MVDEAVASDSQMERRQHPRVPVELLVDYWQTPEVTKGGRVLNLSQAGLLMQSIYEIEIGTRIKIRVYFSEDNKSDYSEGDAKIVWGESHREEEWEGYKYGVNIWRMPLDYKDRLMNYLLMLQEEKSSSYSKAVTVDTSIMEVSGDGLKISLMDGSVWQPVHVGDLSKTNRWYRTQRIKISKNNKGEYELTNLDTATSDKIEVSRIF